MSTINHAVLSAAGIGSRLGLDKPKCLVEVNGRSLLDYHLERLRDIETVWLIVGFHEDEVIENAMALRSDIIIVRNPNYARTNTLQSIHLVSRYLDERFLTIDADTVIENESFTQFLNATREHGNLIGVSTFTTADGVGTLFDGDNNVVGFSRDTAYEYEWTGIAVIEPKYVIDSPIFVYQALEEFLPIQAYKMKAFDVDTAADLDMARHILANNWN